MYSDLTDNIHRSAKAFKFGLRGGNFSGSAPADLVMRQKDLQNFVSLSRIRYRQTSKNPHPSMVTFHAIWFIQDSFGQCNASYENLPTAKWHKEQDIACSQACRSIHFCCEKITGSNIILMFFDEIGPDCILISLQETNGCLKTARLESL